jgi:hypothetical protein
VSVTYTVVTFATLLSKPNAAFVGVAEVDSKFVKPASLYHLILVPAVVGAVNTSPTQIGVVVNVTPGDEGIPLTVTG